MGELTIPPSNFGGLLVCCLNFVCRDRFCGSFHLVVGLIFSFDSSVRQIKSDARFIVLNDIGSDRSR